MSLNNLTACFESIGSCVRGGEKELQHMQRVQLMGKNVPELFVECLVCWSKSYLSISHTSKECKQLECVFNWCYPRS